MLKTRFFMNVSHELRTPLTIIKGLTEDLERHSGSEESSGDKETLRTISRNTNRLIRHVNELLDLSVLTRGVPSPHIVCADLSRFLKEISETFIPLADSYKIAFTYSIAPDISIAYFDKNILEQVLYNLLSNAFKYTPDGGSVSFSALLEQSSSDAVMTLRITDSGIGIPPESLPYIFDQYYKGESMRFAARRVRGSALRTQKSYWSYIRQPFNVRVNWGKVLFLRLPCLYRKRLILRSGWSIRNLKWKRHLCGNQFHWKEQTRSRRIYDKRFCL